MTQAVGTDLVVASVQAGNGMPVMVINSAGRVARGLADIAVKGFEIVISNIRF